MKSTERRDVEILVLSDIHLGTHGCRAEELLKYLQSINPHYVILNGDIIDIWQFKKRYWPSHHMQVIRYFTNLVMNNVPVKYICGNHDEVLRKFDGFKIGTFSIANKTVLKLNGKKVWIFHGDVFDVVMQYSKWLAKMGSIGYDILIMINGIVNRMVKKLGKERISLSKKVKNSVKKAVKYIGDFENTAAEIAISKAYDYVICGHIHQPQKRIIKNTKGKVMYMNTGDWIENLTALEYNKGVWSVYSYFEDASARGQKIDVDNEANLKNKELFNKMLKEFKMSVS